MNSVKVVKWLLALVSIFVVAGCALQDDIIILEERLIVLERQNQTLQQQQQSLQQQLQREMERLGQDSQQSEKSIRTNYASMNADMNRMQEELRGLNGRIEELDYRINRELKDIGPLSRKVDEMSVSTARSEQRVTQLEQYLNFDGTRKPELTKDTGPAAEAAPASDQKMYDDAKRAFDNGELDKARQGFALLIKTFPQSGNADNAQFWIGESYFREKWYEKAILEYQTVLEKYPKGNKVPAAMLKQGLAFLKLGDKSNARLILKELQKKHPNSNEARIAAQKLSEF